MIRVQITTVENKQVVRDGAQVSSLKGEQFTRRQTHTCHDSTTLHYSVVHYIFITKPIQRNA